MNKRKIIILRWPSCAGKSTAAYQILSKYSNIFHVSKDNIKWSISDYSSENKIHRKILNSLLLEMVKTALDNWMSILFEWPYQVFQGILTLGEERDVEIKVVNIEASFDVLEKRFQERMMSREKKKMKASNNSVEWLKKRFNFYQKNKTQHGITLNSWLLWKFQIFEKIENYILLWEEK